MFKKIIYTFFPLLLIILLSITEGFATGRQQRNISSKNKTVEKELIRGSPADTSQYSILMNGKSNTVEINGKIMVNTLDSTNKKNNIRITGEDNSVSIIQTDQKSEVKVSQKGNNNQVHITQK
jgi:hypothetical protein